MRVKDLVKFQIEYANKQLARHSDSFDNASSEIEFKLGVIALLENMLHDSGNYNGFMFVDNSQIEIGTPGYYSRKYFLP